MTSRGSALHDGMEGGKTTCARCHRKKTLEESGYSKGIGMFANMKCLQIACGAARSRQNLMINAVLVYHTQLLLLTTHS